MAFPFGVNYISAGVELSPDGFIYIYEKLAVLMICGGVWRLKQRVFVTVFGGGGVREKPSVGLMYGVFAVENLDCVLL